MMLTKASIRLSKREIWRVLFNASCLQKLSLKVPTVLLKALGKKKFMLAAPWRH